MASPRRRSGDIFIALNGVLLSAAPLALGAAVWWIDVLCSFRWHAAIVALILAIERARLRRGFAAGLWVLSAFVLTASLSAVARAPIVDGEPHLRILMQNVLTNNRDFARGVDVFNAQDPDVLCVLEADQGWLDAMEAGLVDLPTRLAQPRSDNFGLAVFSKKTPDAAEIRSDNSLELPVAELVIDGVRIIAVHTIPPIRGQMWSARNALMEQVRERAQQSKEPTVIVGDFNLAPASPTWGPLTAGLRRAQAGFFPVGTWPAGYSAVGIAIDHALVTPGVSVTGVDILPMIGSDHRGLVVGVRRETDGTLKGPLLQEAPH